MWQCHFCHTGINLSQNVKEFHLMILYAIGWNYHSKICTLTWRNSLIKRIKPHDCNQWDMWPPMCVYNWPNLDKNTISKIPGLPHVQIWSAIPLLWYSTCFDVYLPAENYQTEYVLITILLVRRGPVLHMACMGPFWGSLSYYITVLIMMK